MKKAHLFFVLWAGFLGVVTTTTDLTATTLDPVTSRQLVSEATFIFEGTVVSINHRNSNVDSADDVLLPHTFVTFKIDRVHKGRSENGSRITLRFLGGPDGKDKTLVVPGIPHFEIGDRDFLFVRGNAEEMCPTVGWSQGRFRIADGALLNDQGVPVGLNSQGELVVGSNLPAGRRLDSESFRNFVEQKLRAHVSSQAMALLSAERSPNMLEKFYVKADKPAGPPAD